MHTNSRTLKNKWYEAESTYTKALLVVYYKQTNLYCLLPIDKHLVLGTYFN